MREREEKHWGAGLWGKHNRKPKGGWEGGVGEQVGVVMGIGRWTRKINQNILCLRSVLKKRSFVSVNWKCFLGKKERTKSRRNSPRGAVTPTRTVTRGRRNPSPSPTPKSQESFKRTDEAVFIFFLHDFLSIKWPSHLSPWFWGPPSNNKGNTKW